MKMKNYRITETGIVLQKARKEIELCEAEEEVYYIKAISEAFMISHTYQKPASIWSIINEISSRKKKMSQKRSKLRTRVCAQNYKRNIFLTIRSDTRIDVRTENV